MENKVSSSFKYPITISDAIVNIESRKFLLPAIQRKFVWSCEQIEVLFDSIMRNYPINSFMMWNVTSDDTKNNYSQSMFLSNYVSILADEFIVTRENYVASYEDEIREVCSVVLDAQGNNSKL
jgi:hypothetical protein